MFCWQAAAAVVLMPVLASLADDRSAIAAPNTAEMVVSTTTWSPGDLCFVGLSPSRTTTFDKAIAATGAATVGWLKEQGYPYTGNQTAVHGSSNSICLHLSNKPVVRRGTTSAHR
jgi:hypothetical protein